jgi:hypothetical protein
MSVMTAILAGLIVGLTGVLLAGAMAYGLTALVYGHRDVLGRKVGGLYHWRIGRIGGSFYLARKR